MPTKLSRMCEGLMEAAWLAAILLVPVFFNIYSSRIFEPDKIALLRSLALVALGAWVVKLVDEGRVRWEQFPASGPAWKFVLRFPLAAPVLALALSYAVATLFSIAPATSLWGSYARLQGLYSTLSYLVLFAAIAGNLRRRSQVERAITAAIAASLPISFYGILQRIGRDPIPWGGDVLQRITANMGNSIFVAAYLIMVLPLTVIRMIQCFTGILKEQGRLSVQFTRATLYVFILALQVLAIVFSGSRGPVMGLGVGVILGGLMLAMYWRTRWLAYSIGGAFVIALSLLLLLNISGGPLERVRQMPGIGRFGQLLNPESNNALVRAYIWKGAAELFAPHDPLTFPDGSRDRWNFLRPWIGYGPESLYVAFNPFYPPELTQVEKRNASPDRSHNETWDALIFSGILGFFAYLAVFSSVFYFGLSWLGLIQTTRQKRLFWSLLAGGGVLTAGVFIIWRGPGYLGVGLPFGMIAGLALYLAIAWFQGATILQDAESEKRRSLLLIGLLAAVIAHFIEINFGIAIAATRTYFWVYAGLMLALGAILPGRMENATETAKVEPTAPALLEKPAGKAGRPGTAARKGGQAPRRARSSGKARPQAGSEGQFTRLRTTAIYGLLTAVLLAPLAYNHLNNSRASQSAFEVIWLSLSRLQQEGNQVSYGLLVLVGLTWLVSALIWTIEAAADQDRLPVGKTLLGVLGISLVLGGAYFLWHADGLADLARHTAASLQDVLGQVNRYESLIVRFYVFLCILLIGAGAALARDWPRQAAALVGAVAAPVMALLLALVISLTNLRVVRADIAFKLAESFARPGTWPVAIAIYERARLQAPAEDYYYLFLGRAYLEQARAVSDATERDALMAQAEKVLKQAQDLNPLNTDHTANLARLYSQWASLSTDAGLQQKRAATSSQFFAMSVQLSPHNAKLWDEWALLALNLLKKPDEAYPRLTRALELDVSYDWTYALLGDYFTRSVESIPADQDEQKQQALKQAAEYYRKAIELVQSGSGATRYNYSLALAGIETQRGQPAAAIAAYTQAIEAYPNGADNWRVEETIARLYFQQGDRTQALAHAQQALASAPADQQDRLQSLITEIGGLQ